MPYDPQLGMMVFDPLAAYASGQPAAEGFIQGQKLALERQQDAREQEKMAWLRRVNDIEARAQMLRQQGMSELDDLVNKQGIPFNEAFLKVAPKLYANKPEEFGKIMDLKYNHEMQQAHNKAMEDVAKEANRIRMLRTPEGEADALATAEDKAANLQGQLQAARPPIVSAGLPPTVGQGPAGPIFGPSAQVSETPETPLTRQLASDLQRQQTIAQTLRSSLQKKQNIPAEEASGLLYDRLQRDKATLTAQVAANPDDADAAARLQSVNNQLQAWETRHNATEETIETTPGGVRITRGKPQEKGALTVGERTALGKDIEATSNALRSLGQLSQELSGNVVGILPTFKSKVFDKFLSQFVEGFADPERVKGRELIGISGQMMLGELNGTGRFSATELKRIENLLPSTGPLSSAAEGHFMVSQLSRVLAEKGADAALKLGREVPREVLAALSKMSNEEIWDDATSGYLDPRVAKQAANWPGRLRNR